MINDRREKFVLFYTCLSYFTQIMSKSNLNLIELSHNVSVIDK